MTTLTSRCAIRKPRTDAGNAELFEELYKAHSFPTPSGITLRSAALCCLLLQEDAEGGEW